MSHRIFSERVTQEEVLTIAKKHGIATFGGRGVIGAVAAVALRTQPQEVLLDLSYPVMDS